MACGIRINGQTASGGDHCSNPFCGRRSFFAFSVFKDHFPLGDAAARTENALAGIRRFNISCGHPIPGPIDHVAGSGPKAAHAGWMPDTTLFAVHRTSLHFFSQRGRPWPEAPCDIFSTGADYDSSDDQKSNLCLTGDHSAHLEMPERHFPSDRPMVPCKMGKHNTETCWACVAGGLEIGECLANTALAASLRHCRYQQISRAPVLGQRWREGELAS